MSVSVRSTTTTVPRTVTSKSIITKTRGCSVASPQKAYSVYGGGLGGSTASLLTELVVVVVVEDMVEDTVLVEDMEEDTVEDMVKDSALEATMTWPS